MKLKGISDQGLRKMAQLFPGIPTKEEENRDRYLMKKLSELSLEDMQEGIAETISMLDSYLSSIDYYTWNADKYIDPEDRVIIPDGLYTLLQQAIETLESAQGLLGYED